MRSLTWKGDVVPSERRQSKDRFTRMAHVAELSCCRAESRAPATQNRPQRCGDHGTPEGRQRRTSRPLQSRKSRACHAKGAEATGRQRDARDVHHAPCRAESRAPATQNRPQRCGDHGTPEGRQRDARGVHHAPCRAESRALATQNRPQRCGDHGTPEGRQRRTSRPLQSTKSRACHAK